MPSTSAPSTRSAELERADSELIIHPYLPGSVQERVVMVQGSGCRLRDAEGR
jgi:putrescine aminotransferase